MLFAGVYERIGAYNRESPVFALGLLSMVVQGGVLAHLFRYVHRGRRPLAEGVVYAIVMGTFMYTTTTLGFAAKTQVASLPTFLAVQAAFHLVQFLVAGAILGAVFGRRGAPAIAAQPL